MSKWEFVQLAEVGLITTGNTPSKSKEEYYINGTIPLVKPTELGTDKYIVDAPDKLSEEGFKKAKKIKKGSIMVCCIGSLGKIGIAGRDLATNQQINSITFDQNKVDFKFGYYYCTTLENKMNQVANKAVVQIINKSSFSKFIFPLPPLPVQKQIVAKLDASFERIDKSIALLEENIKHTQDLMASVLDEEFGNGDIPIKDVCFLNPKKSEAKKLINDNELVSFLPMAVLNEKQIDFIPKETKPLAEVYKGYTYFKDNDVLLAKVTPSFENGKSGIAVNLKNGIGFGTSEIHVLRPKEKVISEWIYYAISTKEFLQF